MGKEKLAGKIFFKYFSMQLNFNKLTDNYFSL